jgi:hypothetical protein
VEGVLEVEAGHFRATERKRTERQRKKSEEALLTAKSAKGREENGGVWPQEDAEGAKNGNEEGERERPGGVSRVEAEER